METDDDSRLRLYSILATLERMAIDIIAMHRVFRRALGIAQCTFQSNWLVSHQLRLP